MDEKACYQCYARSPSRDDSNYFVRGDRLFEALGKQAADFGQSNNWLQVVLCNDRVISIVIS